MGLAVASSLLWRYAAASACVAIALATRMVLAPQIGASGRFEPFYTAVLLGALLGRGPGLLASALSVGAAWYFFTPPEWSFVRPDAGSAAELALFGATAALAIVITDAYRRERDAHTRDYELFKAVQDISLEGLVIYSAVRDASGAVADFKYRYANPVALAVTRKASPGELVGDTLLNRLPSARTIPALYPRYVEVMTTGAPSEAEYELGGEWYHSAVAKLDDGLLVTIQNISTRKRAEAAQNLLLAELNHRVKNLLASVIAMATMAGRQATSPAAYREELLARLHALSRAHGLLSASAWTRADVAMVVSSTLEPYLKEERLRFAISGPALRVRPDTALALHMALHELATNAVKYGALSTEEGRIDLTWRAEGEHDARLVWKESGGPPVQAPAARGFGSRLFESAFGGEEASAKVKYEATGLVCELRFRCEPEGAAPGAP